MSDYSEATGHLFVTRPLRDIFALRRYKMETDVAQFAEGEFLRMNPSQLAEHLSDKYQFEALTLQPDQKFVEEQETRIDVSRDPDRFWPSERRRKPSYVPGQQIVVYVPFTGEQELFLYTPSTHDMRQPNGILRPEQNCVTLPFLVPSDRDVNLAQQIEQGINHIKQYIDWQRPEVEGFNNSLRRHADDAIRARRERLLQNQTRVSALGIPLRRREDAVPTYALPTVKRKLAPAPIPSPASPEKPEPILDDANYEHILSVMQGMTEVMERSPTAFATMDEEHIRQHFLVQLNGQYEGSATGETFNYLGKTDILIRFEDRNVFIAECKFWRGSKAFSETIDQLLRYKTWRDTKTAILVFSRDTAMSTVLKGIRESLEAHSNRDHAVEFSHETGFRYVFHHSDDPNRKFVLTALVFDIPRNSATAESRT